ncbi:MAG: hypothetical protein VXX79_03525 [Pseudomonadota bacterium]|nr:hypothetical protein [Pseudomonadota bacterium]
MQTLGLQAPIFAFSQCRDLVAAASGAGGMSVLGTTHITAEQLEIEHDWLDAHMENKSCGVDLIFASNAFDEYKGLLTMSISPFPKTTASSLTHC